MTSGGAPLKPWELARGANGTSVVNETTLPPQEKRDDATHNDTRNVQQPQTYIPYSPGMNHPYTSPYHQTPRPYGSSYYGYPATYGNAVYGSGYSPGGYGGMYGGYGGRPAPWTQQPPPGTMMGPHGGSPPKMPMWQRFLDGLQRVVHCFGRVSFLVDENTQAFHFFITALLAFLDKAGSLYGEIARFVVRLLGFGRCSRRSRQTQGKIQSTETLKTLWKKQ